MPDASGLMVVWFWIRSRVSLPLVLGFFAHQSELSCSARRWGHVDHGRPGGGEGLSCRGFCSVPGSSQTVQRAELWVSSVFRCCAFGS